MLARDNTKPRRVAIYLRQSQDRDGNAYGIERQREECKRLVEQRGWVIVGEFVDNDVSALSRKPRPQFEAMMAAVDGGGVDVIVARHMDRLLRRLAELESVLARCEAVGAAIVTAADSVDTSNDGGRLVARLLASVAQGEVERKSARQRAAVAQAAKQGRRVGGRRPFGYEQDGVTVRPDEAALIKQGYEMILAGESIAAVARSWNTAGIPPPQQASEWGRAVVRDCLSNPRYAGLRRHRPEAERDEMRKNPELGIVGTAEWPAIVDEPTWRAVAKLFADPSRRRAPVGGKGLLTGLAVCGVCDMTVHRGGAAGDYPMYRCRSNRHVSRRAMPVDEYVEATIVEVLKRPDAAELWKPQGLPNSTQLMAEADVLRKRLDDLAVDYADGIMSRDQFRIANDRVGDRLNEIENKLAAAGSSSPLVIVAAKDVDDAWSRLTTAQRRAVIATLCTPVLHSPGRGVRRFDPATVGFRWHHGDG
ncbi:recombinase family protein [Mycobacterium sp. NPDC050853]|uniref:recombinase family protein n=1 Tax=Mycobacterium sp. NPDC050853 TaxID=3155160 RepID=UPI0033CBA56F